MFAAGDKEAAAKLLIGILNSGWVPRWWWGIILIDAGGLLQGWFGPHNFSSSLNFTSQTKPFLSVPKTHRICSGISKRSTSGQSRDPEKIILVL
jgi:hypothetical protein